jgi:hypothetical protein
MKHILLIVGLVAAAGAVYFFIKYSGSGAGEHKNDLIYGTVLIVVSLICFGIHFFKKFRAEGDEDISITKF